MIQFFALLLFLALGFVLHRFVLPSVLPSLGLKGRVLGVITAYSLSALIWYLVYLIWNGLLACPAIDPSAAIPLVRLLLFAAGYLFQKHLINRIVENRV